METVLAVHRVTANGGAELLWEGLGADGDAWALDLAGEFAYKGWDNHYGLHVSM